MTIWVHSIALAVLHKKAFPFVERLLNSVFGKIVSLYRLFPERTVPISAENDVGINISNNALIPTEPAVKSSVLRRPPESADVVGSVVYL